MTQRGFIQLAPMAWAAIAAGVVIAGLGTALWVQGVRLDSCKAANGKLEAQAKILGSQIAEQNRAVEALRAEGIRKEAEGVKALRKAEGRAQVWDKQAKRLTAILASRKPTDDQSCAAAWKEIRKP